MPFLALVLFTIVLTSCSCSKEEDPSAGVGEEQASNSVNEQSGIDDESESLVSSAIVTLTEPLAGEPTGWLKRIRGTCSEPDMPVDITLGSIVSTVTCSSGSFETHLDISSLAVGVQTLSVTQTDSEGLVSDPATVAINKIHSGCDSPANRARDFSGGLSSGNGSVIDPYLICSIEQLREVESTSSANNFVLGNDLYFDHGDSNGDGVVDLTDTDYSDGTSWVPFNTTSNMFGPEYSYIGGQNFTIYDFHLNTPGLNAALFNHARYRVFRDLKIKNANVTGINSAAIGENCNQSVFYNVHVTGTFTGSGDAGGICVNGGSFIRASASGSISSGRHAGGIVGWGTNTISESKFTGSVSGDNGVGGLIGRSYASNEQVYNSYVNASVIGNSEVGGITGQETNIYYSYFTGRVEEGSTPSQNFGGITGSATGDRVVYNCVNAGEVFAPNATQVGQVHGSNSSALVVAAYLSSASCSGSGGCNNGGTARANLTDLFSVGNVPINSWDFVGNTGDGHNDSWRVSSSAGTPYELWWESNPDISPPFSGSGTLADPFLINSEADIERVSSNNRWMDASFRLTTNLNLSLVTYRPIAHQSVYFGQEFDGNNMTVSNLSLSETDYKPLGFIGRIVSSSVKDMTLSSVNVSSPGGYVGGLAATLQNASISKVAVTGTVTAGLRYSGGLTGEIGLGSIAESLTDVVVNGVDDVGGLVGSASNTLTTNCYSLGDVTGTSVRVGGLIGNRTYNYTTNSFATGDVTGLSDVGGFVGRAEAGSFHEFDNNFATGNVAGNSAASDVGHFIGSINDTSGSGGNDFFSGHTCNNTGGGGPCNSVLVGAGQAPESFFYENGNAPLSAWDFTGVWLEDAGPSDYPTLR